MEIIFNERIKVTHFQKHLSMLNTLIMFIDTPCVNKELCGWSGSQNAVKGVELPLVFLVDKTY